MMTTSSISRGTSSPEEVEEVFAGDHQVRRTRQKRYIALGETLDGRLAANCLVRKAAAPRQNPSRFRVE
jgi:hypothetical protein